MSLTELEHAKLLAMGADANDDGEVSRSEAANYLNVDGQKYLTADDYDRYKNNSRPDLIDFGVWKKRGRQVRSDNPQYGGNLTWFLEVKPQLEKGLALVGELEGELGDIHVEDAYNECRKEGMGGKANTDTGFACWNVWHEVEHYGKRSFPGLVPTGVRVSTEKLQEVLAEKELTEAQKKKLMTMRFGGMGINEISQKVQDIQRGVEYVTGKEIDFRSAMLLFSQDPEAGYNYSNYQAFKLLEEAVEKGNPRAVELFKDIPEEEKAQYDNPPSMPEFVTEVEGEFFVDIDSVDETILAMTPYDFENDRRIYGSTINKFDAKGNRVEKEGEWWAAEGGWEEHPKFGPVRQVNEGWFFSSELGFYYQDTSRSSDWIWTEDTGKWLWTAPGNEGQGIFFYAHKDGDPEGSEWIYPDYDEGTYWDYNDKVWRTGDEIQAGELDKDLDLDGSGTVEPDEQWAEMIGIAEKALESGDINNDQFMQFIKNRSDFYDTAIPDEIWEDRNLNSLISEDYSPPVADPVVDTPSDPVSDPVIDPVDPVIDPVDPVIDPVVDPIDPIDPVDPVDSVDPVDPVTDNQDTPLGNGWFQDEHGPYFEDPERSGWKFYAGDDYEGWWFDHEGTDWAWSENTGWMWNDKTDNWWYSQANQEWAYSTKGTFVNEAGEQIDFLLDESEDETTTPSGPPPSKEDAPKGVPSLISYDNFPQDDLGARLDNYRGQLDKIAQNYRYKGYDEGFITSLLKRTPIYEKMMKELGGDGEEAMGLGDEIVNMVAKKNAQEANVGGTLDMLDTRGGGMLDPMMTPEQKLKIRMAKPSKAATQIDVDEGRASEVGEIILNPDYDENLSYYFEYENPETGELETRAFRPDMPAKQPAMGIQERLIDGTIDITNQYMDELTKVGEDGKTNYQRKYDDTIQLLKDEGILSDTPGQDLYTKEALAQMNYLYGDDEDSYAGKLDDYNKMQKHLREQSNYLRSMDTQRDLDNSAKLRAAIGDVDPKINARNRGLDRIKLARFGGGSATAGNNIRTTGNTLFENDIRAKVAPKDISAVTGLGDTYTQEEIDVLGIGGGLDQLPQMTSDLKENQYSKNIISPGSVASSQQNEGGGKLRSGAQRVIKEPVEIVPRYIEPVEVESRKPPPPVDPKVPTMR